jgi:hypothetical protein
MDAKGYLRHISKKKLIFSCLSMFVFLVCIFC